MKHFLSNKIQRIFQLFSIQMCLESIKNFLFSQHQKFTMFFSILQSLDITECFDLHKWKKNYQPGLKFTAFYFPNISAQILGIIFSKMFGF